MRLNELCPMPDKSLGNPGVLNGKQESIFQNVLLTASSLLAGVFILKALKNEKSRGWQAAAWFGLSGSWIGALKGISGILYHFSEKRMVEVESDGQRYEV